MSFAAAFAAPASAVPMSEMNTTPLIDVMLVLLVMVIITVPPVSHTINVDIPQGPPPKIIVEPVKNVLGLDPGGMARWNGKAVNDAELSALLRASAAILPQPETHFIPAATVRYERVDRVLAMTRQSGVTKLGFVGNQNYATVF